MIKYNISLRAFLNILFLLFIAYLCIKSFTILLDLDNIIYCMDRPPNNNQGNNNWFGTVANLAVNGGIAYGADRSALAVSSSLTAAPSHVKVGSFIVVYAGIYVTRRFVDEDRINNLVNNANNWGNNRGGNWFNSPLESGEALQNDSLSLY